MENNNKEIKDLLILGSGPAGLSASIYASRYKIDHLVLGAEIGGYLNEIHKIENYPGFDSIKGTELAEKMVNHVRSLGVEIIQTEIKAINKEDEFFRITTDKKNFWARNIIYSIGTSAKKLNIPGEKEFLGRGVSYCATCDGPFFRNKTVTVVGGGNSAIMAVMILAGYAKKVRLFYRGDRSKLSAAPVYVEQAEKMSNVEIVCCTNLKEIKGENKVSSIVLDRPYQGSAEVLTEGVFIEIGSVPNIALIQNLKVALNARGFIQVKADQSTNVAGFFAAGDITTNSNGFRQIITACAEGAVAVEGVYRKIKSR